MTSCLSEEANDAGIAEAEFCGTSAMDPGSGPRSTSLNTRMLKNEFAATAKCTL